MLPGLHLSCRWSPGWERTGPLGGMGQFRGCGSTRLCRVGKPLLRSSALPVVIKGRQRCADFTRLKCNGRCFGHSGVGHWPLFRMSAFAPVQFELGRICGRPRVRKSNGMIEEGRLEKPFSAQTALGHEAKQAMVHSRERSFPNRSCFGHVFTALAARCNSGSMLRAG